MIKNIVFDIGGVLTDFRWEGFLSGMFDKETEKVITEAMWENPDWIEFDKGNMTDEEVLQLFISKAPDYEAEIRLTFSRLGVIQNKRDSSIPLIEQFKSEGFKVYYLSNYFEYLMHVAPQALDFLPHMDGGVFSCYEHVVKPNPEIYDILCKRYGLNPNECIFIDDSIKNVKAAENFGMKAIHFHNHSSEILYQEIKSLAEVNNC